MSSQRTLIVGLGSAHGDDTAGWRVVERLRAVLVDDVESLIAAHPIEVLEHLQKVSDLHICDACHGGRARGHLHCWHWPEFVERTGKMQHSSHAMSLDEALRLGTSLGLLPPRVTIWGIDVGESSSTDVAPLPVDQIVDQMLPEISRDYRHA
jgi:hydrogenase maturation protease